MGRGRKGGATIVPETCLQDKEPQCCVGNLSEGGAVGKGKGVEVVDLTEKDAGKVVGGKNEVRLSAPSAKSPFANRDRFWVGFLLASLGFL